LNITKFLSLFALVAAGAAIGATVVTTTTSSSKSAMKLGTFSLSLTVKDLATSRAFYEKLGFREVMGEPKKNWLILRHGETTLGLFQGMFPRNTLTFNPGWDGQNQPLPQFDDIRELQRHFKAQGLKLDLEADEKSKGPAHLMLTDPDGNPILLDQHI
jgi:catechol 2,3-dioxygenase-like lactoylglutathione lyase family enzyme